MATGQVAVLGGTFDPIHYAHLRLAVDALERFGLERAILVPAGNPPHKTGDPVTTGLDRYIMTLLAVAEEPRIHVSTLELDRPGLSYTVDTLAALQLQLGQETRIHFIVGSDAALEMHTWKEPERVLDQCQLLVAARPGFDLKLLDRVPVPGLVERMRVLESASTDISSTDIRRRIRDGRSIRYLLPPSVEDYIHKQQLYRR